MSVVVVSWTAEGQSDVRCQLSGVDKHGMVVQWGCAYCAMRRLACRVQTRTGLMNQANRRRSGSGMYIVILYCIIFIIFMAHPCRATKIPIIEPSSASFPRSRISGDTVSWSSHRIGCWLRVAHNKATRLQSIYELHFCSREF